MKCNRAKGNKTEQEHRGLTKETVNKGVEMNIETKYENFTPIHPGAILRNELDDRGITQRHLAIHIKMRFSNINEICNGKRGISAPMAWKLSKAVGASPQFWMNLQNNWELSQVDKNAFSGVAKIAA